MRQGLIGLRVVSFESRRSAEMGELIRNYGGKPILAPAMREVALSDQHDALAFGEALLAGDVDVLVLLTGAGTRLLVGALSTRWSPGRLAAALGRLPVVCRGPKPAAALKEMGLVPTLTVPEPNTWRDVLWQLDLTVPLVDGRVAVQEYGTSNAPLLAGLRERGARVMRVRVYGWGLPEDTGPLRAAIDRVVAGTAEVALFTSSNQAENLFRVAAEMGRRDALQDALRDRTVVGSIGPITNEALRAQGIEPDLYPDRPKMGHLLATVADQARDLLQRKRTTVPEQSLYDGSRSEPPRDLREGEARADD